jgi:hypothetical protein
MAERARLELRLKFGSVPNPPANKNRYANVY